ncbi:DUF932 domain-containing protein [Telluribacter humicola]|uniref:DUF932 domain-containing protein n=1 Tax=Telluribacter humicola TaxID=1720261 RepID=UPI001A9666FE|nr:DUF932 domain-containing protein [Telluribacter humicola]
MGHNIERNSDFVSLREKPWHNLGTIVEQEMSINEALLLSNLDFTVEKLPNHHHLPSGEIVESTTSFFSFRTDNERILGDQLGRKYTPLQNREAFGLIDEVVEKGELIIETAGCLEGGAKVFVCCRRKTPMVIGKQDEVYQYMVMANGHDGHLSAMAYFTTVRVVCNNTLNLSLRKGKFTQKIVIRHTPQVQSKYYEALRILGALPQNEERATYIYNRMAKTRLTQKQFYDYIGNVFFDSDEIKQAAQGVSHKELLSTQKKKMVTDVIAYCHQGVGQDIAPEMSAWWAYNGITSYLNNFYEYKSEERRMTGLLWGKEADRMETALGLMAEPERIIPVSADLSTSLKFSLN